MRKCVLYLCLTIGLLSILVFAKLWLIPFFIWNIFPQNDLMSKIYEVLIIAFGGIAFLLFIILGYIGKRLFQFSRGIHLALHFMAHLPFAARALSAEPEAASSMLDVFVQGWSGLLAEPARLVFMEYDKIDALSIVASFLFIAIGRKIEIVDEQQRWRHTKNQMKAGRV